MGREQGGPRLHVLINSLTTKHLGTRASGGADPREAANRMCALSQLPSRGFSVCTVSSAVATKLVWKNHLHFTEEEKQAQGG